MRASISRGGLLHQRGEVHLRQDVAAQVHARRSFLQRQPLRRQGEHTALGDEQHLLAARGGMRPAEGAVLHGVDELVGCAVLHDTQQPAVDLQLQPPGSEGAHEHHFLGVLADVDEAARARQLGAELADVEVAFAVGLGQPEEGHAQPAASNHMDGY
nr:hypothetical protein [uncultured Albidiferax sp.]